MWLVGCSPFFSLLVPDKKKPFPNAECLYLVLLNGSQRVAGLYSRGSNHHQFILGFSPLSFCGLCWKHGLTLDWCESDRDELIIVGTEWTGFSPCRLWPFHFGTLFNHYCKHNRPLHINEEFHFILSGILPSQSIVLSCTTFLPNFAVLLCLVGGGGVRQGWRKPLWFTRSVSMVRF